MTMMYLKNIGEIIVLLCLIIFIIGCDNDNIKRITPKNKFDIVCINGHEYYFNKCYGYTALAIKLDDNGKPIKCEE